LRETLTFLAGLLLALLLGALVGPAFIDWRDWRAGVEARLVSVTGLPVEIGGTINLRFLPTPRLNLGSVKIGAKAEGAPASFATIEQLDLELAPGDLLRGKIRFSDAVAEGVTFTAIMDGKGAVIMPKASLAHDAGLAFERLRIGRSELRLVSPGGQTSIIGPIALEASAPHLTGPWRAEGEIAGQSVRLVTGETEGGLRTRTRLSIGGDQGRLVLDGYLVSGWATQQYSPGFDGTVTMSLAGEGGSTETSAAVATIAGKLGFGGNIAVISDLSVVVGDNIARLEGDARLDFNNTGPSSLTLKSRRLDLAAMTEPLQRLAMGRWAAPGIVLPEIALSIDAEQVVVLGEDTGETSLRGWLGRGGLTRARLGSSLAGARLGFDGNLSSFDAASGAVNVSVPDTRRLALALNRMGLEDSLADAFSGLGTIDLQASGSLVPGTLTLDQAIAASPLARLEASGSSDGKLVALRIKVDGLDVSRMPSLTGLTTLASEQDIRLDLTLSKLRLEQGPGGDARVELFRRTGSWSAGRFSAQGFGGLVFKGDGQGQNGSVAGSLDAPLADVLLGLAGPFLPNGLRVRLAVAVASLSPVSLRYDLTRKVDGAVVLKAEGMAGGTRLRLSSDTPASGANPAIEAEINLPERALLFQSLGLARPASDGPAQVSFRQSSRDGHVAATLAGTGLSIKVEGAANAAFSLSAEAERAALLLPDGVAQLMPDGKLSVRGTLSVLDTETRLDQMKLAVGPVTGEGNLVLASSGAISGGLKLPALALPDLAGLVLRATPNLTPGTFWSSTRFGAPVPLPSARMAIQTPALRLGSGVSLSDANLDLSLSTDGLRIDNIRGRIADGVAGGNLAVRRDGGLASLSGRVTLDRIDAGQLTANELKGRASGHIEFGGSGESPARLVSSLGGSGELRLEEAVIAGLDPAALARVVAATDESAAESDRTRLGQRLTPALAAAGWPLGSVPIPLTLSGGAIRFQRIIRTTGSARADFSGLVDLRVPTLDLRANLVMLGSPPKGWSGPMPQVAVGWRGPLGSPKREIDPAALSNGLAARALAREIERVEAFEADIRERSFFARRLRAERDMREAEAREAEAARLAEIQRILDESKRLEDERIAARNQLSPTPPLAPLPPPLDIRSVPQPLSRP
jgi:AsmA family/AsmA-like C-terminal region